MTSEEAIRRLKAHEAELRRMGVTGLSVFGSTARGDTRADSDVDLAARLDRERKIGAFDLIRIEDRLAEVVGTRVDLVTEPSDAARLQAQIDRDRVHVF